MSNTVALGTGNTAVVSFSISLELLNRVRDVQVDKKWSRSAAIRILLNYGLIYQKMLEEGYFEKIHTKNEEATENS